MATIRHSIDTRRPSRAVRSIASLAAAGLALAAIAALAGMAPAAHASDTSVVFDSLPASDPGNYPSLGFQATQTAEMGEAIHLGGTDRRLASIEVGFSSWACETGGMSTHDCATTPGDTFTHPVTVNVYESGDANGPGALVASQTDAMAAPYRPSQDDVHCTGADAGKWFDGTACFSGDYFTHVFAFPEAVTLPDDIVVSVAFSTTSAGPDKALYPGTGPYSSLNVAVRDDGVLPAVGSVPDLNAMYIDSTWTGGYCDAGAAGTGTLRLDTDATGECWAGASPIPMRVTAIRTPAADDPAPAPPSLPTTEVPAPAPSTTNASGDPLVPPTTSDTIADPPVPGESIDAAYPAGTFAPYEWVDFVFYSVPAFSLQAQADASGGLSASIPVPASVPAGSHTLVATGTTSGIVSTAAVLVAAAPGLAATGIDPAQVWELGMISAAAILAGAAAVLAAMTRRRRLG